MPTAYTDTTCTASTLLATIRTAILASTDWAEIGSNRFKATTTRGAQMVIEFAGYTPSVQFTRYNVHRLHDGTTGTDTRTGSYLWYQYNTGGSTTTSSINLVVSAGKDHLFISTEGPRAGMTGADDSGQGSARGIVCLNEITPYFASDSVPAVALISEYQGTSAPSSTTMHVSRDAINQNPWMPARMGSIVIPGSVNQTLQPKAAVDSTMSLWPYMVVETQAGLRGRLKDIYYAGQSGNGTSNNEPQMFPNDEVTVAGRTYVARPLHRGSSGHSIGWGVTTTTFQQHYAYVPKN